MIRILQLFSVGLLLGASTLWAADFKHDAHLAMAGDPPCITCHTADAPEIQPDLKVCLECHDQAFVDSVKLPGLVTHGVTWALTHREAAVAKSKFKGVAGFGTKIKGHILLQDHGDEIWFRHVKIRELRAN